MPGAHASGSKPKKQCSNGLTRNFQNLGCPNCDIPTQPNLVKQYRANIKFFDLNLVLWTGQRMGLDTHHNKLPNKAVLAMIQLASKVS